jgi:hypothetical protein
MYNGFLECGLMGYDTVYCGDNQRCGEIYSTALRIYSTALRNIQYRTQNSLQIEVAHSSKMLVTTYDILQDAIILDITTQFFTAVKSINIYKHTQYLSGAKNCYDSWLPAFSNVYLFLILTSFEATSPSLSFAEGSSLKRQYLLRSRRALHSPTGCHVYTSGHSRKEGL